MFGFALKTLAGAVLEAAGDCLERTGDAVIDPFENITRKRKIAKKLWHGISKKEHYNLIITNANEINEKVLHNKLLNVKQTSYGYTLSFNNIVDTDLKDHIDTWFKVSCEIKGNRIFVPAVNYEADAAASAASSISTENSDDGDNASYSSHSDQSEDEQKFQSVFKAYGIKATVIGIDYGKTIDRITVKPNVGFKIQDANKMSADMARDMGLKEGQQPIIIPNIGGGLAAIDMPTKNREFTFFDEMIHNKDWHEFCETAELPMMLGEQLNRENLYIDFANAPQGLFGGMTGSGKSVGTNSNILSLMSAKSPKQVRFWMLDPKRVELASYNNSPYLLDSVATNLTSIVTVLMNAVAEMERRYTLFEENAVRDLKGFNRKMRRQGKDELYRIIIVHEEVAKAVLSTEKIKIGENEIVSGKEIDRLLTLIAQESRAAGMHLYTILQNPNAELLSQALRANIPMRVAFQVHDANNSKAILGVPGAGAQRLTGKGDAMIVGGDVGQVPVRYQSAFIDDDGIDTWIETINARYVTE